MRTNRKYKFTEKELRFEEGRTVSRGRKSKNGITEKIKIRSKSREELDILYSHHVKRVQEKYERIISNGSKKCVDYERYLELKRCEVCADFINDRCLILCDTCDDGYHYYCLKPPLKGVPEDDWTCPKCEKEKKKSEMKKSVQSTLQFERSVKKVQKNCHNCKNNIDSGSSMKSKEEESLKTCIKCQKDFHLRCFRKDWEEKDDIMKTKSKGKSKKTQCKIICDGCENNILNSIRSTKISDYFKPEKNAKIQNCKDLTLINKKSTDFSDVRSVDSNYSFNNQNKKPKNEGKFKLPKNLTEEQKKTLKGSLMRALLVKNIEFDDDLTFPESDCPSSLNNASAEVGIQKISEYNKQIYYKFKERSRKGEYTSLEVVDDDLQGFIVRATDNIPALTLICEYTGDVTFTRLRLFDKNDSMMELIRAPSSSNSLLICPEKKGNIARFISGINNYDGKGVKKQNVKSIRYDIDGQVHVLLYAAKNIKKNDTLYYDYNAGGHEGYPTEQFI